MRDAIPRQPLTWPEGWRRTTPANRHSGQFRNRANRIQIGEAVKRVLYELSRLGIGDADAVISTNLRLRLDGLPRADQGEPIDSGVAVYWEDRNGKMKVMAVDQYDRVADNLAAVAATLEAMRAIERHGGGEILERSFTGFTALPPPPDPFKIIGVTRDATEASVNAAYRAKMRAAQLESVPDHNFIVELNCARDAALKIIRGQV